MQSATSQGLKFSEVVQQEAVLVFRLWGHVMELPDVTLPDAQREDLDTSLSQSRCHRSRVSTVRVAICDEENDLRSIATGVTKYLLFDK